MMAQKSRELRYISDKELMDFSKICEPLIGYIRKYWNWKSLKPKRYETYKSHYNDFDGDEQAEKQIDEFDGVTDETASSFAFPEKTALHRVCYDDTNQGRDPLHVLMSACVSFGLNVGEERCNRKIDRIMKERDRLLTICNEGALQAERAGE